VFLHIVFLHIDGSKNPINLEVFSSNINFTPYFVTKDLLGLFFLFIFCVFLSNFYPNLLGHSDNYIKADILSTPLHIVPEWYFLPYYEILRAIDFVILGKDLGILLLLLSIFILLLLSIFILLLLVIIPCSDIPTKFDTPYRVFFYLFVFNFFFLM
jgi:quinol-cytochrome oxidoreductase complex cytochrome b subunit